MAARIAWLDVARGISILLVVIYHVLLFARLEGIAIAGLYDRLNAPLQTMRMPLFFAVSALLMARGATMRWTDYLQRYVWPVVWVFLLWNTAYVLLHGHPVATAVASVWNLDLLTTHLWFLWALVAFRLLGRLLDRVRLPALAVAAGLSLWAFHVPMEISFVEKNLLKYGAFFLAALWHGPAIAAMIARRPGAFLLACLAGVGVFWLLYLRSAVAIFGVVGICAGSVLIVGYWPGLCRLLSWFGRNTLPIFLLHVALLPPLLWLGAGLPGHGWWLPPVAGLIAATVPVWLGRVSTGVAPWLYAPPRLAGLRWLTGAVPAARPASPR